MSGAFNRLTTTSGGRLAAVVRRRDTVAAGVL